MTELQSMIEKKTLINLVSTYASLTDAAKSDYSHKVLAFAVSVKVFNSKQLVSL